MDDFTRQSISGIVELALAEDVGAGDITASLIPATARIKADIISRAEGVLCGTAWAEEVFRQLDSDISIDWELEDGAELGVDSLIARIGGPGRPILTGERTALNFLQTLSGTATCSREYARLVQEQEVGSVASAAPAASTASATPATSAASATSTGSATSVTLLDTRKTLPGLRLAQKYAVRVGGCENHRLGLFDGFLIKENHISACGSLDRAVALARTLAADKQLEVEVDSLEQLQEALAAGVDIIMLDNFSLEQVREAVGITAGRAKLEVSGGVTADTLVNLVSTGVDYVSIGALTKHCQAVDLSLLIKEE
ncbi:MAG: carboxylating nicotinate-nucleotide diphosphorylase [Pseudohongiellaceae bacterium]